MYNKYRINETLLISIFKVMLVLTGVSMWYGYAESAGIIEDRLMLSLSYKLHLLLGYPVNNILGSFVSESFIMRAVGVLINITLYSIVIERIHSILFSRPARNSS